MLRAVMIGLVAIPPAVFPMAAQTVRDSAGVHIVTDARPLASIPLWHVAPKPEVDLGGENGGAPMQFNNVMGAVRLTDGTIAVANMATNEIRLFNAKGGYLRAAGRVGDGPGEFRQLMTLRTHYDTLVATDVNGGPRFFTPAGKFARQVPRATDAAGHELLFRGLFGDGSLLYTTNGQGVRGARIFETTLVRVESNDSRRHESGTVPAREMGTEGSVFDARWSTALFPQRFCHGYSTRFEIACLNPGGATTLMIRRTVPLGPVPDSARKLYEEVHLHPVSLEGHSGPPNAADIARLRKEIAKFVYPKQMPAFGPMIAGRTGELWVSEFQQQVEWANGQWKPSPPRSTGWLVFAENGSLLGRIVLPARFALTDAGADYLLGVQRDEDDVEHVMLYRFRRG